VKYISDRKNVNNQYLTNVFGVAFDNGFSLPTVQVNFKNENSYDGLDLHGFDACVVMVCGNENHESVDHYLEDPTVKMVIKNYPRMINVSNEPEISQEYATKINQKGHRKFIIENEKENIFTIPLGTCNNFNPIPSNRDRLKGGFIGQWTQIRQDKFENIRNNFPNGDCPYDFAFYNGFGPFVQIENLQKSDNSGSLRTDVYSNFMSNSEIAFIPNGQSPETYRLFEAASAGCIVVHDVLPDVWYYESLPHVPLESENFIPVKNYIEKYSEELKMLTSIWWQSTASPVSVGKKIAAKAKEIGI